MLADPDARQVAPPDVVPTPTQATTSGPAQRLIVRFRPQARRSAQQDAHQAAGALRADALWLPETVRVVVPAATARSALASYASRPDVVYAEPDFVAHALDRPNDPSFGSQWGLQRINAPGAWNVTHGSSDIRVAVVDCGIFDAATGRLAGDGRAGPS